MASFRSAPWPLNRKSSGPYLAQFTDYRRSPRRKRVSLETYKADEAERRLQLAEQLFRLGSVDPWSLDAKLRPFRALLCAQAVREALVAGT